MSPSPPLIMLIVLIILQIKEDPAGLFSDLEPSPEETEATKTDEIFNYYKIYD